MVLADRKFLSWALAREFLATGAHILWRASAAFALKPVKVLADGTYLAELKPPRKSDGPPVTVRVIEYTVHTTAGDGAEESSEVFCLVTSLLDQFCASLCDAVWEEGQSQQMLEQLERMHLFVVALDQEGIWYRYHHWHRGCLSRGYTSLSRQDRQTFEVSKWPPRRIRSPPSRISRRRLPNGLIRSAS